MEPTWIDYDWIVCPDCGSGGAQLDAKAFDGAGPADDLFRCPDCGAFGEG